MRGASTRWPQAFHSIWVGPSSVTQRSPLHADGTPHERAATDDGAVLARARSDKERKYHDVHDSPIAELITLGVELGGRWNDAAHALLRGLAKHKVRNTTVLLRRSAELAWADRWWSMLAVTVQNSFAASVLAAGGPGIVLDGSADDEPEMDLLFDAQRWDAAMDDIHFVERDDGP